MNAIRRIVAAIAISGLVGCGGTFRIIAPHAAAPIAASTVLFGPDRQPLRVGEELEVVGRFERTESHWALLWSTQPLGPTDHDLSEFFDEQVRLHGGEAITGLTVSARSTVLFNLLGIVPLMPTLVQAEVSGEVVRRRTMPGKP